MKSTPLVWRLVRTESGEIRYLPIKKTSSKKMAGGTVSVTITKKMFQDSGLLKKALVNIGSAGGVVTGVKGRLMTVEVDGININEVGAAIDSFGCQWDLN